MSYSTDMIESPITIWIAVGILFAITLLVTNIEKRRFYDTRIHRPGDHRGPHFDTHRK